MTRRPIVSISGIRGELGSAVTPTLGVRVGVAVARLQGPGDFVLARDTRVGGAALLRAVADGLASEGARAFDAGVLPTPGLAANAVARGARGGVMVTASHCEEAWNGFKVFDDRGRIISEEQLGRLKQALRSLPTPRPGELPEPALVTDAVELHHQRILHALGEIAGQPRASRVVVDACNGAAYSSLPVFLARLGMEVETIHCQPGGHFPRDPETRSDSLTALSQAVVGAGCVAGLACDPDGDRLCVVDERGQPFSEEETLLLAALPLLEEPRWRTVVTNRSTTAALDELARQVGARVTRTAVGELHVVKAVLELGSPPAFGGEGNGGVILPTAVPTRDAILAAGLVLAAAARFDRLSEARSRWPAFERYKMVLPLEVMANGLLPHLTDRMSSAGYEIETSDGVYAHTDDAWIHIRQSNTEPVVRVVAESRRRSRLDELRAILRSHLQTRRTTKRT